MWVAIALLIILLILLAYLNTKKPKNFPPGPKWFPILGCALEVHRYRIQTGYLVTAVRELANKYGPILGLKVGQDVQVLVHGYENVKEMLTNENFNGRPNGAFYIERTFGLRRGIMFTDEDFWQDQRRFAIRQLREFGFGRRDMGEIIVEEAQDLVKSILEKFKCNSSIIMPMIDVFNVSVLNTLWTMLTGNRYDPQDKELRSLQSMLSDLFRKIDLVGCPFGHFPFLKYLAPEQSGYNEYMKTHKPLWNFLLREIDKHKTNFKPGEAKDFIDVYLETLKFANKKSNFSELQLMAICMDLFMAGSETTSKSLAFGFLHLLLNPEVQKKAQEEIDQVIGRERAPLLADRIK